MKKREMFLAAIESHGVDINTCNNNELSELEKSELFKISGGYHQFNKFDTAYDKEMYYKIDTPWGPLG